MQGWCVWRCVCVWVWREVCVCVGVERERERERDEERGRVRDCRTRRRAGRAGRVRRQSIHAPNSVKGV